MVPGTDPPNHISAAVARTLENGKTAKGKTAKLNDKRQPRIFAEKRGY
jgi:hypothetical protein